MITVGACEEWIAVDAVLGLLVAERQHECGDVDLRVVVDLPDRRS